VLVTALTKILGYDTCAEIAQRASREGRTIREVAAEMSGLRGPELDRLLDPAGLTRPHGA
jgi:fumarate hydratase class II